jgi:hypothetical protein
VRAAAAGVAGLSGLAPLLAPLPIAGEALRFDLSGYRSRVTREMAQLRLRLTRQAFMVGPELLAANLAAGGDALEVDAGALTACNDEVCRRLEAGAGGAVPYLRQLRLGGLMVDEMALMVGRTLAKGGRPHPATVVAYLLAAGSDQALGGLKFCLPAGLRPAVAALLGGPGLVDALLAPDGPTLWSDMAGREQALAALRQRGPAETYRRRLGRHRREHGYLYAEDVDFRDHETLDALDARVARVAARLADDPEALFRALAVDRVRKVEARRRFAEAGAPPALVGQVLLARALAGHEDRNRRAKMRLLRDLRDLAALAGLDIARDGLEAFVAGRRPVVPSS